MRKMETILVTAIGSFAADIVIKRLKEHGYTVIGCDIYQKEWIADAYNVDYFYQAPFVKNEKEYFDFIFKVCNDHNVNYIFPLTDIEVDFYNLNRRIFQEEGIKVCISDEKTIDICRNKMILSEYLYENNICETIPTHMLNNTDVETLEYPVVVKPFNGRSSQGLHYIDTLDQMREFVSYNELSDYITQPKIEGSIVTVDIVRDSRIEHVVCIARKELLRTLNGAGTSVYVFCNEQLEKQCKELANILNVKGCVNFEFIETDKDEYYFLECNPRFSGGVEFSCMAGYDCVLNHLRCFKNEDIETKNIENNFYIARKYEEYITKVE